MENSIIGKTVQLKPGYAKWLLEHPDVYEVAGEIPERLLSQYERETKLALCAALGEPIYGVVKSKTALGDFRICFKNNIGKLDCYFSKSEFTVVGD